MPIVVGTHVILSPERKLAIEASTEQEIIKRAVSQRAVRSVDDAVVRDLLPTDIGSSTDIWAVSVSGGFTLAYSGSLTDKQVIGIYAISTINAPGYIFDQVGHVGGAQLAGVRFKVGAAGAKTKDMWMLQGKGLERGNQVFGKAAIVYNKSDTYNIDLICTASGPPMVLLGKICEPKGEKISPV